MKQVVEQLETVRLCGERLVEAHRPSLFRMYQDPVVTATLGGVLSDERCESALINNLNHWRHYQFGIWHFYHNETGEFVGRAGLRHIELVPGGGIELAYTVMPEFWNQGYATEMSREVLRVGFELLGLAEVEAFTLPTNLASRRVMQKLGFEFEREGEHAGLPHVFYRIDAEKFGRVSF
jgi:[ribosomal protein S5]-alanine N-acetyltransferase